MMTVKDQHNDRPKRYRVWIVAYRDWMPESYRDVPPEAVAIEPAERGNMSARQAARYVEAFNRAALALRRRIWAVAILVSLRYDGEPRPGQSLADTAVDSSLPAGAEHGPSLVHTHAPDRPPPRECA